jgi:multimeric flavodoxin WrbA
MIGSPRKLGNCELMVKEISAHVEIPHSLQLLRLSDFQIESCRGCYFCLFGQGNCVIADDFHQVVDALLRADALIVAVPTYFLGPNAMLKRLLDRCLALYAHTEAMWGKPSVGVGIAGIPGKEGYTQVGIESFLKLMMTDFKESRMLYGALPGEVFLNDTNKAAAAELGRRLFGTVPEPAEPRCPLCGGRTFRFTGPHTVRCMLCSNDGTIEMVDGKPVMQIQRSEHELFLTLEDALAHREWLVGMKSRFLEKKAELKAVTLPYRSKTDTWVTPQERKA